ncbi:MAG: SUMF1/EgtB/PvdO family nonheme iron enzyme [Planctomycetaceae bacterium]|nr:SUMF1/EgtB/PvdO family nonheme iron enzyme [Planctomycetaceae bacterium]
MSDAENKREASWVVTFARERIAAKFEAELRTGVEPSIEAYLDNQAGKSDGQLLQVLLEIELDYQSQRDRLPDKSAYLLRFPEHHAIVDSVFDSIHHGTVTLWDTEPYQLSWDDCNLVAGQHFGRFELLEEIGRGGMGVVFRARDRRTSEIVALKVLRHYNDTQWPQLAAETTAVSQLKCDGIIPVLESDEANGIHYLTMPFVSAKTLRDVRHEAPISPERAVKWVEQVARSLHAAHKIGVVHRDIKPRNLLLDEEDRVLIADFGLALTDEDFGLASGVAGTPLYMSPEQARGEAQHVDGRSDIFSLGIVLYELLTGLNPFDSPHATRSNVLQRIRTSPVRPMRQRVDILPELDRICLKAMAKSPQDRFATAEDFANALQDVRTKLRTQRIVPPTVIYAGSAMLLAACCMAIWAAGLDTRFLTSARSVSIPSPAADATGKQSADNLAWPVEVNEVLATLRDASPQQQDIWQLFASQPDGTRRSQLICGLARAGVAPEKLIQRIAAESDASIRSALLLALGEYSETSLPQSIRDEFSDELLDLYQHDPSPQVHAATEWLARRWGYSSSLEEIRRRLQLKLIPFDGGWYETLQGQTMVVLPAADFVMGSPRDHVPADRSIRRDETQRTVSIEHAFAISSHEITLAQFERAKSGMPSASNETAQKPYNRQCTWQDAAWYCNRLSEQEGISATQQCYMEITQPDGSKTYREKNNALLLRGYRLPTEAEWEYACRAGSTTECYFGSDIRLLPFYAHCGALDATTPQQVGLLKPNDFGLFDMLGNVSEWVQDQVVIEDGRRFRYLRGGSVWTNTEDVRSANRFLLAEDFTTSRLGFRVARTIRPIPLLASDAVALLVGPVATDAPDDKASDQEIFEEITSKQTVSLGTWNRGSVRARRFRLVNRSPEAIEIGGVGLPHDVLIVEPPSIDVIPAGQFAEFSVALRDFGVGPRNSFIQVSFEKQSESERVSVRVCGSIDGVILHVFDVGRTSEIPRVFDFGSVPVGATVNHEFSILNEGNRAAVASVLQVPTGFRLLREFNSNSHLPGSYAYFGLEVDTELVGERSGTLVLQTSDPQAQQFEFTVRADVIDSRGFSTIGHFHEGRWKFDANRDGTPDESMDFGRAGDTPVTGDWNGDGICDIGICRPQTNGKLRWLLRRRDNEVQSVTELYFGASQDTPVVADIDGNGRSDIGVVKRLASVGTMSWQFDTDLDGIVDRTLELGRWDDTPITGDWDGDGTTNLGVVRRGPSTTMHWSFYDEDGTTLHRDFQFGHFLDTPIVGDWNADGRDDIGSFRRNQHERSCVWLLNTDDDGFYESEVRGFGTSAVRPVILSGQRAR